MFFSIVAFIEFTSVLPKRLCPEAEQHRHSVDTQRTAEEQEGVSDLTAKLLALNPSLNGDDYGGLINVNDLLNRCN